MHSRGRSRGRTAASPGQTAFNGAVGLSILTVAIAFLLVKGLYPDGGHDYYNHYFQFYKRVMDTGSILPNDVWYHFYYSKGAGLYFLGMLLTDPLAPALVGASFIGCGAFIVYAILRRAAPSDFLPLIGVLLYVGAFIYTSDRFDGSETQWGILEKIHELTAVLLLAVIWIAYRLFRQEAIDKPGVWTFALHATIICIALLTLALTLLVGLYMSGYLLWFLFRRQWTIAARAFAAGCTAAGSLLAVAAINYHYSGFPSDMVILQFWPYANLQAVARWGALLEFIFAHHQLTGMYGAQTLPISWDTVPLLAKFLRLDIWWPLFVAATPLLLLQLATRSTRPAIRARLDIPALCALAWFATTVILVALFGGGRSQPVSFYRMSTFSVAPTLCLSLLAVKAAVTPGDGTTTHSKLQGLAATTMFAALLAIICIGNAAPIKSARQHIDAVWTGGYSLWRGKYSLKDAYQNERSTVAFNFGAIYPGIVEPWRLIGPGTRLWSFHIWSYCMLPGCRIQEFFSERFSRSWQTVFFDTPENGIKALKAEGLNYFFFSLELPIGGDPLPASPIFSPDQIAKHIAVRWTDGTSYLLTWPGHNTRPLDRKFLTAYRAAVAADGVARNFASTYRFRQISDYLAKHTDDLHPFALPWCTNCQGLPSID